MNKTSSHEVINWKLPDELHHFSMMIQAIDAENEAFRNEKLNQMLNDSTNIPHYVNILMGNLLNDETMELAIDDQIKQLQDRKKRFSNRIALIKSYLEMLMGRYDLKKFECPNGTVTKVVKYNSRLNIKDEGKLLMDNPEYFTKKDPELDRSRLKKDLIDGKEINAAELLDIEYIQIRR